MDKREIRDFSVTELRADDDTGIITGYAAVFDQIAPVWNFEEVIRAGAFARTISDGADVYAVFNHDLSKIIGRRKNGTLDLREDAHGLHVEIKPPDTPTAQEVHKLVKDKFIDKMSFAFEVLKDIWTKRKDLPSLREILEVKLFEVSPVPFAAYEGTSVSARGYQPHVPEDKPENISSEPTQTTEDELQRSVPSPARYTARLQRAQKSRELMLKLKQGGI